MKVIVRFKPSANLTLIGLLYALAALVQVWYWVDNFYFKHPNYLPGMLRIIVSGSTPIIKAFGLIGTVYHAIFAWIILWMFFIGGRLVWLSYRSEVRITQTDKQRLETLKALGFLLVVFLISFGIAPNLHAATDFDAQTRLFIELFFIELMASMMAGYSMFAIQKYKGG